MSARSILILGVIALIALTLALIFSRPSSLPDEGANLPLVPGLHKIVNDIAAIDITAADGSIVATLRRERERWRVREMDGYEADFALVHDLLRDLASGQRVSERTSNPQWYDRLGLVDVGQPGATGVQVSFPEADLPAVIIGIPDTAGQGHFVRLVDDAASWLADRRIDVPTSTDRWLERAIMDIPARELSEVTVRHPDGDTVILRSAGTDSDDWVLMNVPDDREAAPMWQLRPLANGLSTLNMEAVRRHESVPDDAIRALFVTRDGLNFVASLFEDDEGGWVHFSVSAEVSASEGEELSEEESSVLVDAVAVDARLNEWQFQLTERKFENMTPRLESLLKEVD
jgi:hypothetical protein